MKVCLLAAGMGTRNEVESVGVKALLPVDNRPLIYHLLTECLPADCEIIVAVGYRANLLKEFFEHAFPKKIKQGKVTFVDVNPYKGSGSGPGFSLYSCKEHLNAPFFLLPSDAYCNEKFEMGNSDWLGVARVDEGQSYCLVDHENGVVTGLVDKSNNPPERLLDSAFTGIAYIHNHKEFFRGFEENDETIAGEKQVSSGLQKLFGKMKVKHLPTWEDLGTHERYLEFTKKRKNSNLLKPNECTYTFGGKVLKYHRDHEVTAKKVKRAEVLNGLAPRILHVTDHYFSYEYFDGHLLSDEQNPERFKEVLEQIKQNLFNPVEAESIEGFRDDCLKFYKDKTYARVQEFLERFQVKEKEQKINGFKCSPALELLDRVDWDKVCDGIPTYFHGDLQPENIIVSSDSFKLIDWRHEFVGGGVVGDLYYDLAKMLHGVFVIGEVVRAGHYFWRELSENEVEVGIYQKQNLIEFYDEVFKSFIQEGGYDLSKVDLLTALCYLNIACLYDYPYAKFLYYYGRRMLARTL